MSNHQITIFIIVLQGDFKGQPEGSIKNKCIDDLKQCISLSAQYFYPVIFDDHEETT